MLNTSSFGIEPLVPAYGRSYNSLKVAQEDFDAGKDFKTAFGQYATKSELKKDFDSIRIRYGKNLSKSGVLKV